MFNLMVSFLGLKAGYFAGMMFYWVLWCIVFPLYILGKNNFLSLFKEGVPRFGKPEYLGIVLLVIPVILSFLFGPFRGRVGQASIFIIFLSFIYACVNAVSEEILWRGVYTRLFPENIWLGLIYPTIGFAVWHISPLAVQPPSFPSYLFVLSAGFIGICWGVVAYQTKSIKWTIISHILLDFSGIGALFYFS